MTLQDLFNSIDNNPTILLAYFILLPVVNFIAVRMSGDEKYQPTWRYFFSGAIYAACIPGILAATLLVYSLVVDRQSLLNLNLYVYFLPIVSMIVTLLILRSQLDLNRIPGFSNISGLIMMLVATFIVILIIQKTRIWVVFVGNIWYLVGLFVVLFVLIKIGWERMTAKRA